MEKNITLQIDGKMIEIDNEKNLLEVIRKNKIELPTFCYHSELSVYGACRLCMVDIEGRGLQPACSTPPASGMVIKTNTAEIREMRKIIVELLLANGNHDCPTCAKNESCQLRALAGRLGIKKIRYKKTQSKYTVDDINPSIIRDSDKCVLCGDCVRVCDEIQSIGAIDFAFRGSDSVVTPSFNKTLDKVECVFCGQCVRVCPTGALTIKSNIEEVWKELNNPEKIVIAHIAPAVRIAIGEEFGVEPGVTMTGQTITALKRIGFDYVYDTAFAADLTVIEEGNEFIERFTKNERMPQFTSCCPAWVKFVEQYYPKLINNLSSCRSPQQMFGSLVKKVLPGYLNIKPENLVVVSIMPCTAKKFEAKRNEFNNDTDYVLTTQELIKMIKETGYDFSKLEPESFDLPFGFKTGAGVIFGNSGGVTEAVLRYAAEKIENIKLQKYEFKQPRGSKSVREFKIEIKGRKIRIAVVSGLSNARKLIKRINSGEAVYDFVEVMACPGGCIGGAGQPVYRKSSTHEKRTTGIYDNDKMLQLHKSQENPYITELYEKDLKDGHLCHQLLHTTYSSKKRIEENNFSITHNSDKKLSVQICMGTSCFIKGSQNIMKDVLKYVADNKLQNEVSVDATFCFENCGKSPNVKIGDTLIEACTSEKIIDKIKEL